jgi:muramoyltetrapeptide carboxypeptidase LdcA involved in peptidoglycan recycling
LQKTDSKFDSAALIRPRHLRRGDKVAAISLSWGGPGAIPHRYEIGKAQIEKEFGLQVAATRHALRSPEWLQRNPQARAEDLMTAFTDPSVVAIFSTIGGEDSIRILRYVDLEVMVQHPKIFLGFSDTTVTHLACHKAGLISFYGTSVMCGFAENGGMFPYLIESVYRTLFNPGPVGMVSPNQDGWTAERVEWADPANQTRRRKLRPSSGWKFHQPSGVVRGRLLGGCLEVLDWLRGTDFWPEAPAWDCAILFVETSEEGPPSDSVRRFFRTLAAMKLLSKLAGVLFGRPGGGVPQSQFVEYDNAILQVLREEEGLHETPIVTRMDFGHTDPVFVLPYGVLAEIDSDRQQFSIMEPATVSL